MARIYLDYDDILTRSSTGSTVNYLTDRDVAVLAALLAYADDRQNWLTMTDSQWNQCESMLGWLFGKLTDHDV